jgi:hypothetical protein
MVGGLPAAEMPKWEGRQLSQHPVCRPQIALRPSHSMQQLPWKGSRCLVPPLPLPDRACGNSDLTLKLPSLVGLNRCTGAGAS